jgi:hypothetical protein
MFSSFVAITILYCQNAQLSTVAIAAIVALPTALFTVAGFAEFFAVLWHVVHMIAILVINVRLNTGTVTSNTIPVNVAAEAQVPIFVAATATAKSSNSWSIAASTITCLMTVSAYWTISLTTVGYRLATAIINAPWS